MARIKDEQKELSLARGLPAGSSPAGFTRFWLSLAARAVVSIGRLLAALRAGPQNRTEEEIRKASSVGAVAAPIPANGHRFYPWVMDFHTFTFSGGAIDGVVVRHQCLRNVITGQQFWLHDRPPLVGLYCGWERDN